MEHYFYLTDKVQKGPFTIEELKTKNLTNETFVWTEVMEDWKKIKDIPILFQSLNAKKVPPPPPADNDEIIMKTKISGQLNVTTQKAPNSDLVAIKPSKQALTFLILWFALHLFAMLMSYSGVKIFNSNRHQSTTKFWPLVEFSYKTSEISPDKRDEYEKRVSENTNGFIPVGDLYKDVTHFNGLFYEYDITEFSFYIGGALIIYLLVNISNKKTI